MKSTQLTLLGMAILSLPLEARWMPPPLPAGDGQHAVPGSSSESTPDLSLEERADIYMARKMYREAVETYNRIKPATPVTLNLTGIAYQQQFDYAAARQYYQRAIQAKPNYAKAINNLGTLYYLQGRYRRATALYKRSLALDPLSATIHVNLGMAWLARHNDAEWQRYMQRALELDPDVFERRGSHGAEVEVRTTAERAKFNFCLARLYARSGNPELALQHIRKALEYGFKERERLLKDADFASVRALPEFDELMKQPPKVL